MADEHSFDIVSRIDMQEVTNAIQQAMKEISQRFDFKGSKSNIELDKNKSEMALTSDDEYKLKNVTEILKGKLVKRNVPLKTLLYGKVEKAAGETVKQIITLQQGMKVQSEIQKDQVRVRAKKIDDLQSVIQMLKGKEFDYHIEFINYR